jgi:hypothetical protein
VSSLRSAIVKASAVAVVFAVLATAAIAAEGFDVEQTPVNDSAVWALQAGTGNRYARVNTELHELDTVKDVQNPSALLQSDATALVLMEGNGLIGDIDARQPQDLSDDSTELVDTPTGTASVVSSANFVVYLTDMGRIHAARIDEGATAPRVMIDPYADQNSRIGAQLKLYSADSIAISSSDILYSYSVSEGAVLRFDLRSGAVLGFDDVPNAPAKGRTALTVVGETWALLSADGATLWIAGHEPVETNLGADAVLQEPAGSATEVLVAHRRGLSAFSLGDGRARIVLPGNTALGIPAAPLELNGTSYAAWLSQSGSSGLLWSSAGGTQRLDYGGLPLAAEPVPVLRRNQSRMILNDIESGWVWTIPDGKLVVSSQDWGIAAASNRQSADRQDQAPVVSERKPPVAVADQFGVRAGQLVTLPVLLNDHDPNEDVLTIESSTITSLDATFGALSITNNAQDLAVQVAPSASGSVTFAYAVTDGSQSGGLVSEPATVTLTVYGEETNTAPVWCGVLDCARGWPTLQVQPGGSASVEVLRGWVDPEGDPIYLASATSAGKIGSVASSPDGTVLFQHPDPSLGGAKEEIQVRVADIRGATTEKALGVEITPTPSLRVEPFAVMATANEPLTIEPAKHITGVSGSYFIQSAKAEADDGSAVHVDNGAATFSFTAPTEGSFLVGYTVQDDATEAIGVVRVVVLPAGELHLSTSPITVFVRPKSDATVDVLAAVTNPSHRVLLLSEALPTPLGGAALDVDVVNQQLLRVRGSTADGQAGVLGVVRYTVSDGTGNPLALIRGEATVILLPIMTIQAPIAIADAVTVRAGAQVDIPVLANDLAPDGNALLLNPDALSYQSAEGLAFASGSVIRYLAPATAGAYQLTYTVYSAGSPSVSAQAIVRISVLPAGSNRAPQPHSLTGRVLAGATVSIPFDTFGVDPDGDSVLLDRIVSQPQSGSAAIAPTADAIVYTSVAGFAGPVEFSYRVTDSFGESGTASVRVGVIDQQSDPSPITYSDYVEVQLGRNNHVTVQPAANDIDPAGKALTVTEVVPDAPAGTQEYDDLAALIGVSHDGLVTLTAGESLGTRTFFYTVVNSTGDTNAGLIVMKVVRESVPDHPKVDDTYLTLEQRSSFANGIDVVSGKVTWNSGDINDLSLSLWDKTSGYTVSGRTIAGVLPQTSVVVAFKLTGTNVLGDIVSTYGFLRIPGKNDVILALRSGTAPQQVGEGQSVTFDLADLVSVPIGERLVVDTRNLSTTGKRVNARCTVTAGTMVSYDAGAGEPWVDYCAIPAKLAGQDGYTALIVGITVIPEIPLPILRAAALTHSPAAPPTTYNLRNMVDWAGKEDDSSLVFAISYSGDQFSVVQNNSELTIYALDTASPGRENTVKVSLSSHPGLASAALSLKVGPAPADLPKGGTVAKECSQAGGVSSCLIKVIGVPGEVNVYRTPLALASVGSTALCPGVTMEVADSTSIRASWASDAPGGKCSASFVVRDPQGALSPDDRTGTVLLDLQGFPKAPAALTQSGYGDSLVRLSVSPGLASNAYPALTGFVVYSGSSVVSHCTALGVCDDITGLSNGEKTSYEARSVNAVGDSKSSAARLAWSYRPPIVDSVTREPIYQSGGGGTSETDGWVRVSIDSTDPTARGFLVTGTSVEVTRTGATTLVDIPRPVGTQTITVTPVSEHDVPTGLGPTAGQSTGSVDVAGLPIIASVGSVSAQDATTLRVDGASLDANSSAQPMQARYIAYPQLGGSASCAADANGDLEYLTTGIASLSPVIGGLDANKSYFVIVCVSNGFGVAVSDPSAGRPFDVPPAPVGYSYSVDSSLTISINTGVAPPSAEYVAVISDFASSYGADPAISVAFCLVEDQSLCGPSSAVVPTDVDRTYQYVIGAVTEPECRVLVEPVPGLAGEFGPNAPNLSVTSITYYQGVLDLFPTTITGINLVVPDTAYRITQLGYAVTLPASDAGALYTVSGSIALDAYCSNP